MFNFLRYSRHTQKIPDQLSQVIPDKDVDTALAKLCSPPKVIPGKTPSRIPEERVQHIQRLLSTLDSIFGRRGHSCWFSRPRIYAILRNISGLEFMDEFAKHGITDFYLPFNERTLPNFIKNRDGEETRQDFIAAQQYLLTDAKDIENGVSSHFTLKENGDQLFQPIHPLGQGGFGYVSNIPSSQHGC